MHEIALIKNAETVTSIDVSTQFELEKFVEQLAEPAMLVGTDRRITTANMRADQLFGWENPGLADQLIDVLIPPSVGSAHPEWISSFFTRPASRSMSENPRIEGVKKNGERVAIDISLTPVSNLGVPQAIVIIHDSSRAADGYNKRLVELTALTEISKLTKSGLDALEISQRVARQARNLIPYDRFAVVEFDRINSVVSDWFVDGQNTDKDKPWGRHTLSAQQVREYLELKEPFIERSSNDHPFLPSVGTNKTRFEEGYRTLLCAPLIWDDEIIGALNIRSKSETAYDDESLKIAAQISSVIATALGRTKLKIIAAKSEHQTTVLSNISKLISNSVDVRTVFDSVAIQIDQIIPIDRMVLSSANPSSNRYVFEAEWGETNSGTRPGFQRSLANTASAQAIEAGKTVLFSPTQISDFNSKVSPDMKAIPMMSWIASPLIVRGEAIGIVHYRTYDEDAYNAEHVELATQISSAFAAAINSESNSNDNDRERQIRSSAIALNRNVIDGDSLESLAESTQNLLSNYVDFDRLSIVTIDGDKAETTVVYQHGITVNAGKPNSKMPYSGMARSGSAQIGDVEDLPAPWSDRLKEAGLRSWMYLAIGGEGRDPIAAIWVSSTRRAAFNNRDLEILERLAGVLAPIFHSSALLNTRTALEDERVRVSNLTTQTAILESDAKAKSEFISSVSHEFKTPLTSVVAFSSLLRRDESMTDRQKKQLDLIQNNAWRLEKMIDDLLHVAAADSGGLTFDIQETSLIPLTKEVTESLVPVAKAAGKRLFCNSCSVSAMGAIDPVRYAQAVQNVISNAIKYSPASSAITVTMCELDDQIQLMVRNKGKLTSSES